MIAKVVKTRARLVLLLVAIIIAAPAIYFAVAGRPTLGGATTAENDAAQKVQAVGRNSPHRIRSAWSQPR